MVPLKKMPEYQKYLFLTPANILFLDNRLISIING